MIRWRLTMWLLSVRLRRRERKQAQRWIDANPENTRVYAQGTMTNERLHAWLATA